MISQPMLYVPPDIQLGLLDGTLNVTGSVVRQAANGRIYKHLQPIVPTPEKVQAAAKSVKLSPKVVVPLALVSTVIVSGATYVVTRRWRRRELLEVVPQCVADFEVSLRAYVAAGSQGVLEGEVVGKLITDLDAVKAYSDEGNEVSISLDELLPLFELVINHTSVLAEAYSADAGPLNSDNTVVSLRRHLEAQKRILDDAA